MSTCFLFPGQGVDQTELLDKLRRECPDLKSYLATANAVTGIDIATIARHGPSAAQDDPEYSQILTFVFGFLRFRTLNSEVRKAWIVAGHSLGEYAALAAAGSISFEDGLKIVSVRARAMKAVPSESPFCVLAIEQADLPEVTRLLESVNRETPILSLAAIHSRLSCSISGPERQIAELEKLLMPMGAVSQRFSVRTPVHSPLLEKTARLFHDFLMGIDFKKPICRWAANYDGKFTEETDEIRRKLAAQLVHPVRWDLLMETLSAEEESPKFFDLSLSGFLTRMSEKGLLRCRESRRRNKEIGTTSIRKVLEYVLTDIVCTRNRLRDPSKYQEQVVLPFRALQTLLLDTDNSPATVDNDESWKNISSTYVSILRAKGLSDEDCLARLRRLETKVGLNKAADL